MSNPMALAGFTFLSALILVCNFGFLTAYILFAVGIIGIIAGLSVRSWRQAKVLPVAFCAVAVACLSYGVVIHFFAEPAAAQSEKEAVVTGQIIELPENRYNRYYYIVETSTIDIKDAPQKLKIRVSSKKKLDAEPFDVIKLKLSLYEPGKYSGNQTRLYYYSKGIYLCSYIIGEPEVTPVDEKPIHYTILQIREYIAKTIRALLPGEEGALTVGILLGDRSEIPEETIQNFRATGISHLLAVSGMHVALLAQCILLFLSRFRVSKRISAIIAIGAVVFFMGLTAFAPSINRAGIMMIVYLLGLVINKKPSALNSLGFAVLLMLCLNPFTAVDYGFLLSVSSTLGIVLMSSGIQKSFKRRIERIPWKWTHKPLNSVGAILSQTIPASLFILPVNILVFREVSLIGPLSNILQVAAGNLVMIFSGLASIFSVLGALSFLQYPFMFLAGMLSKYMIGCAKLLAGIPFASVPANQSFVQIWLAGVLILLAAVILMGRKKNLFRLTAILSITAIIVGTLSYQIMNMNITTIHVADVGNGTAVTVTRNGHGLVIGCGGDLPERLVFRQLSESRVKNLDLLLIPRYSDTESCGVSALMKKYPVDVLQVPNKEELKENFPGINPRSLYAGEQAQISVWNDVQIFASSGDDDSYIFFTVNNTRVLLVCLPSTDLAKIPQEFLNCDLLICRQTFPVNYQLIHPQVIFFSANDNGYLAVEESGDLGIFAVTTSGMGSIFAETRGNRDLSLWRDSDAGN